MVLDIIDITITSLLGVGGIWAGFWLKKRDKKYNKDLEKFKNNLLRGNIVFQERFLLIYELSKDFRECYNQIKNITELMVDFDHRNTNIAVSYITRSYDEFLRFSKETKQRYTKNKVLLVGILEFEISEVNKILDQLHNEIDEELEIGEYRYTHEVKDFRELKNQLDRSISNFETAVNQYFENHDNHKLRKEG